MAVTFTGSSVSALASDLVLSAGLEVGVFSAGDAMPPQEAAWGLEKLQRIIDQWNAVKEFIFSETPQLFSNVAPNISPLTIGPTGTLVPSDGYRPVRISAASFVLNPGTSNPVDTPINIRDVDWWMSNPVKSQRSSIITDLFYSPAQPNGQLYFWPVCNTLFTVRLNFWNSLKQVLNLNTQLGMVQGYWEALVLTLGLALCPSYGKQPSAVLVQRQKEAVRIVTDNNAMPPRIDTAGAMPSAGAIQPDYDFLTGARRGFGL